ncbi:hypothetical protein N0V82_009226 [Gnomoniopsis sp. IMI 355080]|nr:hypothetical protein N0V82_009226 [Gnomoniopsis sp. IMI 355080]
MASKKYALITGCSEGGIGYALALEFQRRGVHVFATARKLSKMSPLEGLPNVTLLALNVTSQSSIENTVAVISKHTGGTLDYLVNNAGNQYAMPVLDLDIELAKQMFDVNFWGVFAMIQAFSPLVIAAKGTIANMASIAALMSPPYLVTYASSKAACEVLSEGLRRELAPFGVKVATVITGAVATNLHNNTPLLPLPEDSFYKAVKKQIADRASGADVKQHLGSCDVLAEKIVGDLLRGASGKIYRGNLSTLLGIIKSYFPEWIMSVSLKET